ncbi:MAG: ATP-NAD kinase [Dehalococcoidia bacterium]|mgnify:CR=1 FL=1|nr:ATP-NAD kinase [Dehalococcoidia bacterium]
MSSVGIIANPSAGKDIRRLVASGRVISNQEKANIITRFVKGLSFKGVKELYFMPDKSGLFRPCLEEFQKELDIKLLDTKHYDGPEQTLLAAELINQKGCDCALVLGGDGTNRLVAKKIGNIPLVPISTGTNNAFPINIDPTVAGLAAGFYIQTKGRRFNRNLISQKSKLSVIIDKNHEEIALIDLAISNQNFIGSKAIWDPNVLDHLFLTQSNPLSIGLSAIGSKVTSIPKNKAIKLDFSNDNEGEKIYAPIAPGLISEIYIKDWQLFSYKEKFNFSNYSGTIALDGEREIEIYRRNKIEISLKKQGPYVLDVIKSVHQENF